MGEVVDDEDVGGGEEDGGHVADDDLAVQVVQLRDRAVDDESDKEEEAGDGSADGVDQPQDAGSKSHLVNTILSRCKFETIKSHQNICNIRGFLLKLQPFQPSRTESSNINWSNF